MAEALQYPIELNREAIKGVLPHRGELQLINAVTVLAHNHYIGHASWTEDSLILQGHFPDLPIVPGVLLIEAVAQVAGAGMLTGDPRAMHMAHTHLGVLAGVRKCNFRKPILPGDDVQFDVTTRQMSDTAATASANVTVAGEIAASIEIFVINVPREAVAENFGAAA